MKKMFKNSSHTHGPLSSKNNVQAKRYGQSIPKVTRASTQVTRAKKHQGVTNEPRV